MHPRLPRLDSRRGKVRDLPLCSGASSSQVKERKKGRRRREWLVQLRRALVITVVRIAVETARTRPRQQRSEITADAADSDVTSAARGSCATRNRRKAFLLLSRNSRYAPGLSRTSPSARRCSRRSSPFPFLVPTATSGCQECLTRGMASRGVGSDRRFKVRTQSARDFRG